MKLAPTTATSVLSSFMVRAVRVVTSELLAFMEDFKRGTTSVPMSSRNRMWEDSIIFDVGIFDGNIDLDYIVSVKEKGAGNASKAMQWLCSLADKHKVPVNLEVKPMKKAGAEGKSLNTTELRKFYAKFGFKKSGSDSMIRLPSERLK